MNSKPRSAPKQKLKHGQINKADMQALDTFARDNNQDPFRLMLHPRALEEAGLASRRLPVARPEFLILVDTAEPDHRDLVERIRMAGYFAVCRSLKQPVDSLSSGTPFAGDFVVLQWTNEDDDDDDDDDAPYIVPPGYRVLVDIERKEISDLIASFKDNRRERQRAEQLGSSALRHVMILEGATSQLEGRMAQWTRAVNSDYDHMVFAGDLRVRAIATHAELTDVLINAIRYSAQSVMDARAGIKSYLMPTFAGKDNDASTSRSMDDPHTALVGVLTRVKGVTPQAAEAIIAARFPTMIDFCQAMVTISGSPTNRAALVAQLSDIKIPSNNSLSSRDATRFGKRAKRLVDLFAPVVVRPNDDDGDGDDDISEMSSSSSPSPQKHRSKPTLSSASLVSSGLKKRSARVISDDEDDDEDDIPLKRTQAWDSSSDDDDDDSDSLPPVISSRRKKTPRIKAPTDNAGWIRTQRYK